MAAAVAAVLIQVVPAQVGLAVVETVDLKLARRLHPQPPAPLE
jgi:hypothetical protein